MATSSAANPTPNEVTWQTCFWIIVTLAVAAMTQPSGKVCSAPSRYNVYLRSSPFVCFADMLSVIFRLTSTSYRYQMSLGQSLERLVEKRFDGSPTDAHRKAAKSVMLARWVFTVLGGLTQTVRLYSFRGLIWTKFLGSTFVASFLMIEALNLIYVTHNWGHSRSLPLVRRSDASELHNRLPSSPQDFWLLFLSLLCPWFMILSLGWISLTRLPFLKPHHDASGAYMYMLCISVLALVTGLIAGFMFFFIQAVVGFLDPNWEAGKKSRLFLLYGLANLLLCVLGYRYFYDPKGTENPGWTAVFG